MLFFNRKNIDFKIKGNSSPNEAFEYSKIFNKKFKPRLISLKITAIYAFIGCLWILFSDRILNIFVKDITRLALFQIFKGWFYVIATACMLYLLIYKKMKEKQCWEKKLLESYEKLEHTHEELIATEENLESQIYELQRSQKALKISEERFRLSMEGASDGIWDWDIVNNTLLFSRTKEILGYEKNEIENSIEGWKSLIHKDDVKDAYGELNKYLSKKNHYYENEYRLRTKAGGHKWILSRGKAIFDGDEKPIRMAGSHKDITEHKRVQGKIYKLAYYDALTGLPNRTFFEERLSTVLIEAKKNSKKVALLYMDLDNFKTVNDTLGHMFGDELLKGVAEGLKKVIPKYSTFARLGGDEFAILVSEIADNNEVINIVEKIILFFQKVWILNDREFYITPSIGISLYPDDAQDMHEMIKNADTAMYAIKETGKNNYKFYITEMNTKLLENLEIKNNLRHAIEREEFFLYYQPKIDIRSGKICGLEALIRWVHPTLGFVKPYKFIPIAEESDIIIQIGKWVLKEACEQNQKWINKGYPPLKMAVNLSPRQFQDQDLVKIVKNILQETNMNPQLLELEITESLAMENLESTIEILNELKKLGLKISLDDFGTGYSSLNYLKTLPMDTLKIDKTFVEDITVSNREQAIMKAVIDLAHSMELTVIAEGVETKEQFLILKQLKCNKVQGYFFSKPLPAEDIEKLFQK